VGERKKESEKSEIGRERERESNSPQGCIQSKECIAGSLPGTKKIPWYKKNLENPSLFREFPEILESPAERELLYQEKKFGSGRISENERQSNP